MLGIFKIEKEDYDTIEICLNELIEKLSLIKQIEIKGITYEINFMIGGDLKWIATIYGINYANSNYPCPWCHWKKEDVTSKDICKDWSISGRSIQESERLLNKKRIDERKGYVNEPLFKFINFDKCIVDILHLFLRITDKLYSLLLNKLEQLDKEYSGYENGKLENMKLTKLFLDFLSSCDLTAPYYVKTIDKISKYKLRKLNENERLKLFEKLFTSNCLLGIFKDCNKKVKEDNELIIMNTVFSEFYFIYKDLKVDYEDNFNKQSLIKKLREWLGEMRKIEPDITPYMHILCFHVPEFIQQYGCIKNFTMQGLEKFNHITKMNYFRQTNHQKNFHHGLIKKMNRLEFIHLDGKIKD